LKIIALVIPALLSACAMPVQRQVDRTIAADKARAHALDRKPAPIPVIAEKQGYWLLGNPLSPKPLQPAWLDSQVTINNTRPESLVELASAMTENSGVQVFVDPSALSSSAGASSGAGATANASTKTTVAPAAVGGSDSKAVVVSYSGTMRGLLNKIASSFGLYWKPQDDSVIIFKQETRTFPIPAVPMQMSGSGSISTSSSSSGSGGSSGGTSTSGSGSISESDSISINPWGGIESTAKAIAGAGAKAIVDKSNDLLIVTGTPPQLAHVESWIKTLSGVMSKRILLDVEVYDISDTAEDQFAWNPTMFFKDLGQKYGFTLAGVNGPTATSGTGVTAGVSIISPTGGAGTATAPAFGPSGVTLPNQGFTGSGGVIQALSTMAGAVRVLSRSAVTLNGIPATIQSATETGYLAGSTSTQTANVGSSSSLTPGEVTTGFTAILTPRLINGNILLGMNMTLSNLLAIQTETSGTQSIQVPNVSTDGMSQVAMLKPGQTLMLSGLVQSGDQKTQSGVGTPQMQALGGGTDALHKKEHLLILVTASLVGAD
jgi:type II secretory pathway component GspD/PulD (secretin)